MWYSLIVFIGLSSFLLKVLSRIGHISQQIARNEIQFSALVIIVGIFCQQGNLLISYMTQIAEIFGRENCEIKKKKIVCVGDKQAVTTIHQNCRGAFS